MKFTCNREDLLNAINRAEKAVAAKPLVQVMEGLLIETGLREVKITGNDLTLAIEATFDANIEESGRLVVNARMFSEIIRKTGDSVISFSASKENYKIKITSGLSVFEIAGLEPDEFPAVNTFDVNTKIKIECETLRSMIKQTIFATSKDEKIPVLTGILFKPEGDLLSLIAVDKFRFAIRREKFLECDVENQFVVPFKTLSELLKILTDEGEVEIYPARNFILFSFDNCKIYSRSIEGEYIKYEHILNIQNSIRLKAKSAKLLHTFERVSPLINMETIKSPVKIKLEGDNLIIDCVTLSGKVHDELTVEKMCGGDLEIGFNNHFLLDAFGAVGDDEVILEFSTPQSPIKMMPSQGDQFLYLVQPVILKK